MSFLLGWTYAEIFYIDLSKSVISLHFEHIIAVKTKPRDGEITIRNYGTGTIK